MKSRYFLWLVLEVLGINQAYTQPIHKHIVATSDAANLSINDGTSQELGFYQLDPPGESAIKGLLVLLPGFGAQPQHVFQETRLAHEAAQIGLITIVPTINNRLFLDLAGQQFISLVISQLIKDNPSVSSNFFIGGFSAGGHLALSYAETVLADSAQRTLTLKATFGVDPPVDLAQLWQIGHRRIDKNCSKLLVREGQAIVASLTHSFGGSPNQFPNQYRAYSAFSSIDSLGGNAHLLKSVPVRLYAEPDLVYWQKHYCKTFSSDDLTAQTSAMMIRRLQEQGNQRAQYIETRGKGFVGKRPFPHSWSIVDVADCVVWMNGLL